MKKLIAAAALATTLIAAPSFATTYISKWTDTAPGEKALAFGDDAIASVSGPGIYNNMGSSMDGTSTHTWDGVSKFTDTFSFSLPSGFVGFSLTSLAFTAIGSLKFDSVDFNGVTLTLINAPSGAGYYATAFTGAPLPVVLDGPQILTITGTGGANAAWSGTGSFFAVPEPATWGMMIMGFGAIGLAMRNRRRTVAFA